MQTALQTHTKTKTEVANIALIGVMLVTATLLLGLFTAHAAVLGSQLVDQVSFQYEKHDFMGVGEYGVIYNANWTWQRVNFGRVYKEAPVVIAKPLGFSSHQPAHIRLRNVSATGFDVMAEKWPFYSIPHAKEHISFIVVPKGVHTISPDFKIQADFIDTDQNFKSMFLSGVFYPNEPVIFSQVQTYNNAEAVDTRNKIVPTELEPRNVEYRRAYFFKESCSISNTICPVNYTTIRGLRIGNCGLIFNDPSYNFYCVPTNSSANPKTTPSQLDGSPDSTSNWSNYSEKDQKKITSINDGFYPYDGQAAVNYYGNGSLSSPLKINGGYERYAATKGANYQTRVQEQEGSDGAHPVEKIGFIAFTPFAGAIRNTVVEIATINMDYDPVPNSATDDTQPGIDWTTYAFKQSFSQAPAFIADMQTFNGADTAHLRYRNLDHDSVDVMIEEEQASDVEVMHALEKVGLMLIGRPVRRLEIREAGLGNVVPKTVNPGAKDVRLVEVLLDNKASNNFVVGVDKLSFTVRTSNTSPSKLSNFKLYWNVGNRVIISNNPDDGVKNKTGIGESAIVTFDIPGDAGVLVQDQVMVTADIASDVQPNAVFRVGLGEALNSTHFKIQGTNNEPFELVLRRFDGVEISTAGLCGKCETGGLSCRPQCAANLSLCVTSKVNPSLCYVDKIGLFILTSLLHDSQTEINGTQMDQQAGFVKSFVVKLVTNPPTNPNNYPGSGTLFTYNGHTYVRYEDQPAPGSVGKFNTHLRFIADLGNNVFAEVYLLASAQTAADAQTKAIQMAEEYLKFYTNIWDGYQADYCSQTVGGVTYSLNPCSVTSTMVDQNGDIPIDVTIVAPQNSDYSYVTSGYGVGTGGTTWPTYGILGGGSGGAVGSKLIQARFNDNVIFNGNSSPQAYTGYWPIRVTRSGETKELRLSFNLTVNPEQPRTNFCTVTSATGQIYSLQPCLIKTSMTQGENKLFSFTITSTSTQYGFNTVGYGVPFPTYAILGGRSGGGSGNVIINSGYFNGQIFTPSSTPYLGYWPIKITHGPWQLALPELRLGIDLTVTNNASTTPPGSLSITQDANYNEKSLILANTSGLTPGNYTILAAFRATAAGEPIKIEKLNITGEAVNGGGWDQIARIYVGEIGPSSNYQFVNHTGAGGAVPTSTDAQGSGSTLVNITNDPITIEAGSQAAKIIVVLADTNGVGVNLPGESGEGIKLKINTSGDVRAVGVNSAAVVQNITINNAVGMEKYLVRSIPRFTPNESHVNRVAGGDLPVNYHQLPLYRFDVTTSGGDLWLKKVSFLVNNQNVNISNVKLVENTGESIAQFNEGTRNGASVYKLALNNRGVLANQTRTLTLVADISTPTSTSQTFSSISVSLLGDSSIASPYPNTYLNLETIGNTTANADIIWSDLWATLPVDNNVFSSPQWFNGYLVPSSNGGTLPEVGAPVTFTRQP